MRCMQVSATLQHDGALRPALHNPVHPMSAVVCRIHCLCALVDQPLALPQVVRHVLQAACSINLLTVQMSTVLIPYALLPLYTAFRAAHPCPASSLLIHVPQCAAKWCQQHDAAAAPAAPPELPSTAQQVGKGWITLHYMRASVCYLGGGGLQLFW
jgi:hypothetical protein